MRIAINLPFRQADGRAPTVQYLMDRARIIEAVGFDGIWVGDTVGRWNTTGVDSLQWLLAAAASTSRIELGTAVTVVPLRYPVELAQRLMSLAALSGGRFAAGVGSGSLPNDFEAVGVPHAERFQRFAQGVKTIRALTDGEAVGTANLHPWPDMLGQPPILIATWANDTWLKRAAQVYDGWIASAFNTNFNVLRDGIQRFRDYGGQRAMVATVGINLHAPTTSFKPDERFHLNCGPEEAAERLLRLAELGFDDVLVSRLNYASEDLPEEELRTIRALLPKDNRPPYPSRAATTVKLESAPR